MTTTPKTDAKPEIPAPTNVYEAIAAVSRELAEVGVQKNKTNAQQGFKFRGVDDVYQVLAGLLPKYGLVILPRVLTRSMTERETSKGGSLFSVVVEVEYDLVHVSHLSKHTVRFVGEGMDTGDKATNKAMAIAYKYMAFQVFCIPLEGSQDDPDAETHEVKGKKPGKPAKAEPEKPATLDAEQAAALWAFVRKLAPDQKDNVALMQAVLKKHGVKATTDLPQCGEGEGDPKPQPPHLWLYFNEADSLWREMGGVGVAKA